MRGKQDDAASLHPLHRGLSPNITFVEQDEVVVLLEPARITPPVDSHYNFVDFRDIIEAMGPTTVSLISTDL